MSAAAARHLWAHDTTPYAVLGVAENASAAEIRKAYRKAALKDHPDKNPGDDAAKQRFILAAEAFEIVGNDDTRKKYDRGELTNVGSMYRGPSGRENVSFGMGRAAEIFNANLGDELAKRWSPGMRVTGTLVRQVGRQTVITQIIIHPDGTIDEQEETQYSGLGGGVNYRHVSETTADGVETTSVDYQAGLGDTLAGLIVPTPVRKLPVVGTAVGLAAALVNPLMKVNVSG